MATETTSELLYEVKDCIATITLNRPDKMNAFTGPRIERWAASLHEAFPHGGYFVPGTESLTNLARIALGRADEVTLR